VIDVNVPKGSRQKIEKFSGIFEYIRRLQIARMIDEDGIYRDIGLIDE